MSEVSSLPAPALPPIFGRFGQQASAILAQPAVRKSLPVVLGTVALAIVAMIYILGHTPDQRTLFAGLPESDKAAVADALQKANFDVSIDSLGNVQVAAGDYQKARLLLAGQGLPKAAPTGYDLLKDMPLGSSRAFEQARLKQSQETELSNSVQEIAGVESARVHLALPEQSVFVREATPPSASVFVKLAPGRALGQAQVRSIVNLIASSVASLPTDRVSVVDQTGALLTQDGAGGDDLGESRRRLDLQQRMENNYRDRLVALLTPVIGSENFTTDIHLDLDFTETQQTREAFDKDNMVVRSEQGSNQAEGGAAASPKGIPGALTNVAPPAATPTEPVNGAPADPNAAPAPAAAAGPHNETYTRNYEIGKEVSVIKNPVGQLKRVSVAVVLRDTGKGGLKPKDIQAIEQLAKSSIGFDEKRGDMVTVTARPFTDTTRDVGLMTKVTSATRDWLPGVAKVLAALGIFAIVFFMVLKPFLAKALAATGEGGSGSSTGVGKPIGMIADDRTIELLRSHLKPRSNIPTELLSTANSYDDKIAIVRMFVSEDTARASNVVKGLLKSEATPTGAES